MQTGTQKSLPLIIGHRGASREAPENTLESFCLAWELGADGIEADFRLTVDGRIVCMHDETAARTTGVALKIADSRLEELQRLDAGSWKGPVWSGARIPTLDELLAKLPHDSWLFIEIKSGPEIIAPLGKLLLASGLSPERIRLLSFSAPLIASIKQQLPEWRACWLSDYRHNLLKNEWSPSRADVLATLHSSGADGLASADKAFLDQDLVETLHDLNKEIHVWTVDRLPAAERLRLLGVDSIMTNRPGWLRRQLEEFPDQ
jgi:glycerophosphoryl diester phosphodiesterase